MEISAWLLAAIFFVGCGDPESAPEPTPIETPAPDPTPDPEPNPTPEPTPTPTVCLEPGTVEAVVSDQEFMEPTQFRTPGLNSSTDTSDRQSITILEPAEHTYQHVLKAKNADLVMDIERRIGSDREPHAVQYFFLLDNQPVEGMVRVWNESVTAIETEIQGSTYDTGVLEEDSKIVFEFVISAESMPESRLYDLVIVTRDMEQDSYRSDFATRYAVFNGSYNIPAFACFLPSYMAHRSQMPLYPPEQALESAREQNRVFRHLQIYLDDAPSDFLDRMRTIDVTGKESLTVKILAYPIHGERGFIPEIIFPVINDKILDDRFEVAIAALGSIQASGEPVQNGPWQGSTSGVSYSPPFVPVWRGEFEIELPNVARTDVQLFASRNPHSPESSFDLEGSNVIRLVRSDAD